LATTAPSFQGLRPHFAGDAPFPLKPGTELLLKFRSFFALTRQGTAPAWGPTPACARPGRRNAEISKTARFFAFPSDRDGLFFPVFDLGRRAKGDRGKVAMAARLRPEGTRTARWSST